jgi:hypothetical protein
MRTHTLNLKVTLMKIFTEPAVRSTSGFSNGFVTGLASTFLMCGFPMLVEAKDVGPESRFCAEINSLEPGEELVLKTGTYREPCTIRRSGRPGAPIVIRAENIFERPTIIYQGISDNVINVRADHVIIRGLRIGPTRPNVDGIRIYSERSVTIEDCEFTEMGGIAVVANHSSASGLIVRRNSITNSAATAMYFGCHDGMECRIRDLLVEKNFIDGVTAPEREIGYGIQVKLNSAGILRDNVIVRTKGPGIMVYGSDAATVQSVIEGNFTADSRTSSGIVIGGGPAHVFNNISVNNREAGIAIQDYAGRGLIKKITIEHNTIYNNGQSGIAVYAQGQVDAVISKNAIAAQTGIAALPSPRNGLQLTANQDCSAGTCFKNPEQLDFTPRSDSLLNSEAKPNLDRDYFGARRPLHPMVGAVERPGGSVFLGIKP